ncbi:MAG: hypothetical protein HS130_08220 [Deltaproteobacteria bacterium]|nr:hypothetical protein [Deltaproteobacteria bacterium]
MNSAGEPDFSVIVPSNAKRTVMSAPKSRVNSTAGKSTGKTPGGTPFCITVHSPSLLISRSPRASTMIRFASTWARSGVCVRRTDIDGSKGPLGVTAPRFKSMAHALAVFSRRLLS